MRVEALLALLPLLLLLLLLLLMLHTGLSRIGPPALAQEIRNPPEISCSVSSMDIALGRGVRVCEDVARGDAGDADGLTADTLALAVLLGDDETDCDLGEAESEPLVEPLEVLEVLTLREIDSDALLTLENEALLLVDDEVEGVPGLDGLADDDRDALLDDDGEDIGVWEADTGDCEGDSEGDDDTLAGMSHSPLADALEKHEAGNDDAVMAPQHV